MRFCLLFLFALAAAMCSAQDTSFGAGPQYLITTSETKFLRPIATPSMSLNAPLPGLPTSPEINPATNEQPYPSTSTPEAQLDLFPIYYGYPATTMIELSGSAARELPASINDTGYVAMTDVPSLIERGYGVSVADEAALWKSRKRTATRVYTNADLRH